MGYDRKERNESEEGEQNASQDKIQMGEKTPRQKQLQKAKH